MGVHQMQLRYDPVADRLLLSVRTHESEIYAAWLTRRMASRLYGPLVRAVAQLALAGRTRTALPVPEAQEMLIQAARERPLPGADFGQRFVVEGAHHPLGADPLLPAQIDLQGEAGGQLVLQLSEERGRRLRLQLGHDLSTALLRLLEQCLQTAEWGLPTPSAAAPVPAAERSRLN